MNNHSVCKYDNNALSKVISTSVKRIVFMSPGLDMAIARELSNAMDRIGQMNVNIILDIDSEVFRLGYGEIEALTFLQRKASECGALVSHQPGVRIGLLIADQEIIIFTPIPLLITGNSNQEVHPNAIRLGSIPTNIANDIGLGERGVIDQVIGLEKAHSKAIENVEAELIANPPMKFDVAKTMTIFNSRFEFIEFELKNCFISRKEVPLSSDLFGLAKGEKAYESLRSSFKLINKNSKISEDKITKKKRLLSNKYLIPIKGYGVIILRAQRDAFSKEVEILRGEIQKFQKDIEEKLNAEIDKNRKTLVSALLPAVQRKHPERWNKFISGTTKKERDLEVAALLNDEIEKAFDDAKKVIDKMDVTVIPKGITYDLLHKEEFLAAVSKMVPTMKSIHIEFLGVEGEKPEQTDLFSQAI